MCRESWLQILKKCYNGEKHSQVSKSSTSLMSKCSYSIGKDSLFGVTVYAGRFYLVLLRIHFSKMDYITSFQYDMFLPSVVSFY